MDKWMLHLRRLVREENGASAIEYAIIAAMVAAGLVAVLGSIGGELAGTFNEILDSLRAN